MSDYDYDLPEELIAQEPVEPRDCSRLLVVRRQSRAIEDRHFRDLPDLLDPGDLIVMNNTRVRHARLHARRKTGGKVELLLLEHLAPSEWKAIVRPARRLKDNERLELDRGMGKEVTVRRTTDSQWIVSGITSEEVEAIGEVPLPPYIRGHIEDDERYQTVLADPLGSAAAPTAGLHFTPELIATCAQRDIKICTITLHVGLDTFRPVTAEAADEHEIHSEWFDVPQSTADEINEARKRGNRIVAIGTTVVRTLETVARHESGVRQAQGWSQLYITPPFTFKLVDAMVTNFHLPRTTLLLLVSAFVGRDLLFEAYRHAVQSRYRFYSFGDAMIIL